MSPLSQYHPYHNHHCHNHNYHNITTITISPPSQSPVSQSPPSQFHRYPNIPTRNHHHHNHPFHKHHHYHNITTITITAITITIMTTTIIKEVSRESFVFTSSTFTFWGMSRTKASFSHLPLSDFWRRSGTKCAFLKVSGCTTCYFSRMRSKGSRFTLGVWGLRVCWLGVA